MTIFKSAEELNHSRLLDMHLGSDLAEVNTFVEDVCSEYFGSQLSEKRRANLKVLLFNLYDAWLHDADLCIAINLNERRYKARSRYNSRGISRLIIPLMRELVDAGLIHFAPGYYPRGGQAGKGRLSRIWPSETLLQHFRKARFSPFEIDYHEDRECIVLRDEDKNDIEYEDTPETIRMRNVLFAYNQLLKNTHIDCSHLDKSYILKKDKSRIDINQNKKFVRRIFNNSSWKQGGRFYGGWWQQIGGDNRSRIRLDGRRTIEIDYSGLHIVLLYARIGINYFVEYGFKSDPYEINLSAINDLDLKRWLAKNTLLMAVNAVDEETTVRAVRHKARESEITAEGLSLTDQLLKEILDQLKAKHPRISDWLCSGAGIDLQYTDSQVTQQIIEYFTSIDVPVLCIHDSYVIDEDYADALHKQMLLAWDNVTALHGTHRDFLDSLSPQETRVKQIGYTDELLFDDPEGHEEMTRMKEGEYVSSRYENSLIEFTKWKEEKNRLVMI